MKVWVDKVARDERLKALKNYYDREILSISTLDFKCKSQKECKSRLHYKEGIRFYPAQLSHVGANYDLKIDGKDLRIVVSGYDYGANDHDDEYVRQYKDKYGLKRKPNGKVTVDEVIKMVRESGQDLMSGKNTVLQMKACALWLDQIFKQIIPTYERDGLVINGSNCHVFECFALVNMS